MQLQYMHSQLCWFFLVLIVGTEYLWLTGSALAAKVQRNDSLARFLNQRPQQEELVQRHIIPAESEQERLQHRQQIGATLNRFVRLFCQGG